MRDVIGILQDRCVGLVKGQIHEEGSRLIVVIKELHRRLADALPDAPVLAVIAQFMIADINLKALGIWLETLGTEMPLA